MKFFLVILFLLGCFSQVYAEKRKDIKLVEQHISTFSKKMSSKGFYLVGSGGEMMNNIKTVKLSFHIEKKSDVNEARKVIIDMAEEFLSDINADQEIRPFLSNYPFDNKNVEILIGFVDENDHLLNDDVAVVTNVKDSIFYASSIDRSKPLVTMLEESYCHALQTVKSKNNN